MRTTARRLSAVLLSATVGLSLAGCASGNDQLAEQYSAGSNKGYVAGDGTILEIPAAQRSKAVTFSGTDETGATLSSSNYLGKVLVVNFWYAGCAPCRAEAPTLAAAEAAFTPGSAALIGVNVRDQADTAAAFMHSFDISYPSIIDTDSGSVQLAFAGSVPANAVPTTIVLDQQGRVAARILGRLADASILSTIVNGLVASNG